MAYDDYFDALEAMLCGLADYIPDDSNDCIVLGVSRGGLVPAVYVSHRFGLDLQTVKLSRRRAKIHMESPPRYAALYDKHVVVVDDACRSGKTLRFVLDLLKVYRTREVVVAVVVAFDSAPEHIVSVAGMRGNKPQDTWIAFPYHRQWV